MDIIEHQPIQHCSTAVIRNRVTPARFCFACNKQFLSDSRRIVDSQIESRHDSKCQPSDTEVTLKSQTLLTPERHFSDANRSEQLTHQSR